MYARVDSTMKSRLVKHRVASVHGPESQDLRIAPDVPQTKEQIEPTAL
jgi:hypothetical protein